MASHAARRLPDENLTDIFIPIPEGGIPEVVDRLEEDLHIELDEVEDENLFKDGFVDGGLEDNGRMVMMMPPEQRREEGMGGGGQTLPVHIIGSLKLSQNSLRSGKFK